MTWFDSAKQEFADLLNQELLFVENCGQKIYYRPVRAMNPVAADKYRKLAAEGGSNALIGILILRARNADGTKMFAEDDREDMKYKLSAQDIADVVTKMSKEGGIGNDTKPST